MNPENERTSSRRKWLWLLAGIIVFAVALTLVENLTDTGPAPSEMEAAPPAPPSLPTVRWTDDGTIELSEKPFRPSLIRLRDEEKKQQLFDCLEQGTDTAITCFARAA